MTENNYKLLEHRDEDEELIGATCRIGSDSPEIPLVIDDEDDLNALRQHLDDPVQRTTIDQNPYRVETAGSGQVAIVAPTGDSLCFIGDTSGDVMSKAGPLVDFLNRNDQVAHQE